MTAEILNMSRGEALEILGIFTGSIVLAKVAGALLGDLLIGNKIAVKLGGLMQMLGALCLCFPNTVALYIGIGLVGLGSGLYIPNLFSQFGKLYLSRDKDLDIGFLLYYLVVSAGTFIGIIVIGRIAEFNYTLGFLTSGIFYLGAFLMVSSKTYPEKQITSRKASAPINLIRICVVATFIISGVFWTAYQTGGGGLIQTTMRATEYIEDYWTKTVVQNFNYYTTILFCVIALVVWRSYHLKRVIKIVAGFFIGAFAFFILYILSKNDLDSALSLLLAGMTLIGLSEVLIAPTIHSLIVTYVNPKFFATASSLLTLPLRLFSSVLGFLGLSNYDAIGSEGLLITAAIILLLGGVATYLLREKFVPNGQNTPSEIDEIGQPEV